MLMSVDGKISTGDMDGESLHSVLETSKIKTLELTQANRWIIPTCF
jgi:hypothetical protein